MHTVDRSIEIPQLPAAYRFVDAYLLGRGAFEHWLDTASIKTADGEFEVGQEFDEFLLEALRQRRRQSAEHYATFIPPQEFYRTERIAAFVAGFDAVAIETNAHREVLRLACQ